MTLVVFPITFASIVNELTIQNSRGGNVRAYFAPASAEQQHEDAMPTFIRMVAELDEPAELFDDHYRAIALFGGIGLLLALIAASTGEQGIWL